MKLWRLALMSLLAAGLLLPAGASGQTAPPGNSGIDEYLETLPGPGGDVPTSPPAGLPADGGGGPSGGGSAASPPDPPQLLGRRTARRFAEAGPAGRRAARLAAKTAIRREPVAPGSSPPAGGDGKGGLAALASEAFSAGGAGSGGSMGLLLPLILIATLLAGGAFVLERRRRS